MVLPNLVEPILATVTGVTVSLDIDGSMPVIMSELGT